MSKAVKPLELKLETAREQAEYFFNREFQSVRLEFLKQADGDDYNIVNPSRLKLVQVFLESDRDTAKELISEYEEELGEDAGPLDMMLESEDFVNWISGRAEYDNYVYGDFADNHYPMWGWVFACSDFYAESDYMDSDILYDLGIGLMQDSDDNYYLYISGAGYDFYDQHWIPLFKKLGWIKEE